MNEQIMFLPTSAIPTFLKQETAMDKLRIAIKALSLSHQVDYNLDELEYEPEWADCAEPYASLRGYNVPLLADCRMLVDYLNALEPEAFYMDASETWQNICICYIPEEQRMCNH